VGELVNLRGARKAKARAAAKTSAAANRAAHGRTKAEKGAAIAETVRAARAHEGARRDRSDPEDAT
jgi:hypothetical protein